ncbi:MAG: polysaccharide deacetylase family protein, partial [Myxococcales bacterium]|nr:polysaccharide deacetylase family protein [Myxococcales bacterium]
MTNPETQRTRPLRVIIAVLGVLLGFALAAANPVTVVQARDAAAFVQPMGHRVVEGVTPPAPPYAVSNRSGTPSVLRTEDVPEPPTHDATGERFRDGMVITGATPHRLILFTFDDGPHWKTTPRLLDMLDATGIHAVFFLTGDRLVGQGKRQDEQRALVKEIAARGHFVGNHTFAHVQLPLLTEPE